MILSRYAFSRADCFIVQSAIVERELLELLPGAKLRLTPHPIYDIFERHLPKDGARKQLGIFSKNVMLYFGYVRAYKGLMVLIEAMKGIHEFDHQIGDTMLLVVGEFYDDESKYRTRVRELNLEQCVRFVSDYIPNDQVADYFSAADVVMLPYLSATQSGIIQIAYNFDKPVIATNVGGLAEVVLDGTTGFIVPPNDPQALTEAVLGFYREHKESAFSTNVKLEKQKYSWDNFVQNIEELAEGG